MNNSSLEQFIATYVGMVVCNVAMSEIVLSLFVYFVSQCLHSVPYISYISFRNLFINNNSNSLLLDMYCYLCYSLLPMQILLL